MPSSLLHLLAGQTGLRRRKEGSPEGSGRGSLGCSLGWGEKHRVLTVKELTEQSRLGWTQVHAALVSSHLLFCIGAITFAQDATASFLVTHGHVVHTQSSVSQSPLLAPGDA